jgi:energy-coupling factor transporter ATP-binding protein EcfA2
MSHAVAGKSAVTGSYGLPRGRSRLAACIARLDQAIEAAAAHSLSTASAEAARQDARERIGLLTDAYVVALVGGTGVGKSSLLNALAGASVSRASVLRPTTATPLAWVPRSARAELAGILDWLGVAPDSVHEHDARGLGNVAVLDMPDLDSVEPAHRERVEAVLQRVDAVVWVTDPEKYHDALLHDVFLRTWLPRLNRQIIVVNKSDRLSADDAERVRGDLALDVERLALREDRIGPAHQHPPAIVLTSAVRSDVEPLSVWLAEQVEAKQVVQARLQARIATEIASLAYDAGIDPTLRATAMVDATARRSTIDRATVEVLRLVDLPTLERQAVAATRARARARGAGPLGALTARLYRWSGRQARVADPAAFLVRWRERGTLAPALGALRAGLSKAMQDAPLLVRRPLAASVEPRLLGAGLGAAVDRAIARRGREAPGSRVWLVLGLLQTLATVATVFGAVWVGLWVVVRFAVDSFAVPVIGHLPIPFVVLLVGLVARYVIARLLGAHAGWVGRRWARKLGAEVRTSVAREVEASAFASLDQLEAARRALWSAASAARVDCAPN